MQVSERTFFEGTDSFVTVHHLTVRGTNFEIGRALAERSIERYGRSPARFAADRAYARARRIYFQRNYPIHWARVCGAAAAFGLDPDDSRYDLTSLWHNLDVPSGAPGCSVVYYPPHTTVDGHGYLSRNYDFSLGTMADVMQILLPPEARAQMRPVMSEPYVMLWYPEDTGYASLAIHAFDLLAGTLDGMNSAGLVVSIMADEEAIAELGPRLELHPGPPRVIGLHELQVMRFLLDTCATADEAMEALLTIKQYYAFVPCHYIVADKAGNSFIYENSTGRNTQHIIPGGGQPQVVTNFQVHKHPALDQMAREALTMETNAFWRYQTLADRISAHNGHFTPDDIRANNACVNIRTIFDAVGANPAQGGIPANVQARTLWHSLYDQQAGTAEFSFYLGEEVGAERRSEYVKFGLADE